MTDKNTQEQVAKHEDNKSKFSEQFKILASLLVPLMIALVGHWYTSALKEKDIQSKYVEIAISILNSEPNESTRNLRKWAVDIINEYSPKKMSEETQRELDKNTIYSAYDTYLQGLPPEERLEKQILPTRRWFKQYSLQASDLKEMLSKAGFFKGNIDNSVLNQSVIDAVALFQKAQNLSPADGICGAECYREFKELGLFQDDSTVKESGLNIDMNGGPVSVNVVFDYGHTGTYHFELLVDGDFDTQSNDKPLVFSPSLIKELHQLPPEEQNSIIQMTLQPEKISSNNEYKVSVIFEQDGKELTRETVEGFFDDDLTVDRTLMVNINEIE